MTTWTLETEGHMILVEVTGKASAWPVYDAPDLLEPAGKSAARAGVQIWKRYRFKRNHFAKYLGQSIRAIANTGAATGTGGYARDFTNLQWPEVPFGAEQRLFGKLTDMVAAFAVEWADRPDAEPLPVSAATVYLRVRKHGTALRIGPETLSIGFRASVIDRAADVLDLLALVDRALTRARRHVVIVAGHRLGGDLSRMAALSSVPMRGAAGSWRGARGRHRHGGTHSQGRPGHADSSAASSAARHPGLLRQRGPHGPGPLPRGRAHSGGVRRPLPMGGCLPHRRRHRPGRAGRAHRRRQRNGGRQHGRAAGHAHRDVAGANVGGRQRQRPVKRGVPGGVFACV
jgi:hypothetical protein